MFGGGQLVTQYITGQPQGSALVPYTAQTMQDHVNDVIAPAVADGPRRLALWWRADANAQWTAEQGTVQLARSGDHLVFLSAVSGVIDPWPLSSVQYAQFSWPDELLVSTPAAAAAAGHVAGMARDALVGAAAEGTQALQRVTGVATDVITATGAAVTGSAARALQRTSDEAAQSIANARAAAEQENARLTQLHDSIVEAHRRDRESREEQTRVALEQLRSREQQLEQAQTELTQRERQLEIAAKEQKAQSASDVAKQRAVAAKAEEKLEQVRQEVESRRRAIDEAAHDAVHEHRRQLQEITDMRAALQQQQLDIDARAAQIERDVAEQQRRAAARNEASEDRIRHAETAASVAQRELADMRARLADRDAEIRRLAAAATPQASQPRRLPPPPFAAPQGRPALPQFQNFAAPQIPVADPSRGTLVVGSRGPHTDGNLRYASPTEDDAYEDESGKFRLWDVRTWAPWFDQGMLGTELLNARLVRDLVKDSTGAAILKELWALVTATIQVEGWRESPFVAVCNAKLRKLRDHNAYVDGYDVGRIRRELAEEEEPDDSYARAMLKQTPRGRGAEGRGSRGGRGGRGRGGKFVMREYPFRNVEGVCWRCGKEGHKAPDCNGRDAPPTDTVNASGNEHGGSAGSKRRGK